jgi:hypothetical protein
MATATIFVPKSNTAFHDQLKGVKDFFRTLQKEREFTLAEKERIRQLRFSVPKKHTSRQGVRVK